MTTVPPSADSLHGEVRHDAPLASFDEALAAVLALVGEPIEIHVFDTSERPRFVATFGGRLRAGHSLAGGSPDAREAIFLRVEGSAPTAVYLDRELYQGALVREDGSVVLRLGPVELALSRAERAASTRDLGV